jgi:hypothetical protein
VTGPEDSSEHIDPIERLNRLFAAIAGWSFDHRWIVLVATVLLLAGALTLAGQARVDNSFETYFAADDPAYLAYNEYRELFGSDEISYVLYEAPEAEHGIFDVEVMGKIVALTQALEDEVPFIYEARSLTNAELIRGVEDGIEIEKLDDEWPVDQAALLEWREAFLKKPYIVNGLLSPDAKFGAIVIEMDRSSTDPLEEIRLDPEGGDDLFNLYPQVTDAKINEILARPEYEGIVFEHSGDVPLNAIYNIVITEESMTLQAITALVIGLVLLAFFRNFIAALGPVIIVQLTVIVCVAIIALLGWKLDLSFGSVPTLLSAIGVAHSVHVLSEFRARWPVLGDRRAALVETFYLVGAPCLLTSLTTAVGFASMSFVPIKAIARMGIYTSLGVLAAFFFTLTLLVVILSFGPKAPRRKLTERAQQHAKGGAWINEMLAWIAGFTIRRRRPILVFFALTFAVSMVGVTRIIVDSNWLDDFSDRMPLKEITRHVDDVMGGLTGLVYLVDTGEPDGVKDPEVLREIERLQARADEEDWLVVKSYSLVDILKDLNQAFHGDDPAFYKLPDSRELVAQYLLLYETSGGGEADRYVSPDYSATNLEARIRLVMTSEMAKLADKLDDELAERPFEHSEVSTTGIGALWLALLDHIVSSQTQGVLIAFSVIAVLMCLIFRSVKTGLISMMPNLSPVFLTLGAMGFLGIPLDYNKLFIATVAIGIAVDDTIHLVSRYHHEFKICGNYEEALRASMADVGRALVITSVTLVCGFSVLLFSLLDAQAMFGILLSSTIVVALIADFLLMPALVLTLEPFGPEGTRGGRSTPLPVEVEAEAA